MSARGLGVASLAALLAAAAPVRAQWQPAAPAPGQPAPFGGMLPAGLPVPQVSPPTPEEIRTVQLLDQAKQDDAGRRLEWVWIDAQGGFEQLGMQTFSGGPAFSGGYFPTSSSGGVVSVAAGARLLFLTLVVRGRAGVFNSGQLFRVGPEVGFHIPLGRIEPHVELGAGYAAVANLHDTVGGAAGTAITLRGLSTRAGVGLDYFVAPVVSLGIDLSADLLGLFRSALSAEQIKVLQNLAPPMGSPALLAQSSSAWGGTVAVTAVLGIHL